MTEVMEMLISADLGTVRCSGCDSLRHFFSTVLVHEGGPKTRYQKTLNGFTVDQSQTLLGQSTVGKHHVPPLCIY